MTVVHTTAMFSRHDLQIGCQKVSAQLDLESVPAQVPNTCRHSWIWKVCWHRFQTLVGTVGFGKCASTGSKHLLAQLDLESVPAQVLRRYQNSGKSVMALVRCLVGSMLNMFDNMSKRYPRFWHF